MWYVYLIKSIHADWYYVGSTNDLDRRLKSHNKGYVKSTKLHCPFVLCKNWLFDSAQEARFFEQKIKRSRSLKSDFIKEFECS